MLKCMPGFFSTLCARLSIAFAGLFLVLGLVFMLLINWSNNRYYEETTQNLNKSLAMYITQRAPLITEGKINRQAMKELASLAMVVNPIVEVYLLDTHGNILSHALPTESVVRKRVQIAPVLALISGKDLFPIRGDDPRSLTDTRIFSAFPVLDGKNVAGYLYVILGGQTYQGLAQSLRSSYIVQQSVACLALLGIFATASATLVFAMITRPLRQLAQTMNNFQREELKSQTLALNTGDEVQYLASAFNGMRERIYQQLENLQETDRLRRELISNVSHDLRTPMASMQGYLEVLMRPNITAAQRAGYIETAFKHCNRLTRLIKELFELSKLDAGRITPHCEDFSLAELLQDVTLKFALMAQQKNIRLSTPQSSQLFMVNADIALIERVLENLIDNALRYTPEGGCVQLSLSQQKEQVQVGVQDNGIGLSQEDIPYIFERYYRGVKPVEYQNQSTGLGLAIVKRILELHGSIIKVESRQHQGTCFSFPLRSLPQKAAA